MGMVDWGGGDVEHRLSDIPIPSLHAKLTHTLAAWHTLGSAVPPLLPTCHIRGPLPLNLTGRHSVFLNSTGDIELP